MYLSTCPPIYPSIHPSNWPFYLSICLKALHPKPCLHTNSLRNPLITTKPSSCNDATTYELFAHLLNSKMTSISRCSGSVVVVEVVAVLCCSAVAVVYLSVHQSVYIYIHIYTSVCVCGYLFVFLFIDLSIYSSIYPSIYLSASLKTKLFCETFSFFWTWQRQKRSNSARHPTFTLDNIKHEAILRDFLNV